MSKSYLQLNPDLERKVRMARCQNIATPEIARLSLDCLDLTALKGTEDGADIRALCNKAITYDLPTVCVFPSKVVEATKWLRGTDVKVATVINFPFGDRRTDSENYITPETTAEDVSRAIAQGAAQIDIVQPHNIRPGYAQDIIRAARTACPNDITLKSILETASYKDARDLADACLIAIASGADCLKTSTGKHPNGGASLEAVAIMLKTIQSTGRSIGIKVSGGLSTTEDCAQYIALQRSFFGWNSVRPENFRLGGSHLLQKLLETLAVESVPRIDRTLSPANSHDYNL